MPFDRALVDGAKKASSTENEAEVVEKVVVPLLRALDFEPGDCFPQEYLPVTNIGKGRSLRTGYKPDELIAIDGLWLCVLEAKNSKVSALDAWREACEYAQYLNRNYPAQSVIELIVGCNGRELAIAPITAADKDVRYTNVLQLAEQPALQAEVHKVFGRAILAKRAFEHRLRLGKQEPSSVRSLILSGASVPRDDHNPIAKALSSLLDIYCVDLAYLNNEDFKFAYCDLPVVGRKRELEDVLRDRAPAGTQAETLNRNNIDELLGRLARSFHSYVVNSQKPPQSDRFAMVLGDPGSGKTTLLEWYHRFSKDNDKYCFVYVDGAAGPQDSPTLYTHILQSAIIRVAEYHEKVLCGGDEKQAIRDVFATLWLREYRQLYSHLSKDEYLAHHFQALVARETASPTKYLETLLRAVHAKGHAVCLILDNLDTTDMARQIDGFRTMRPLALQFEVFAVLALREETYRYHENSEPFNAFHKSRIFHVPAPTAIDVIGKRLLLLEKKFGSSDKECGSYVLDGGIIVQVSQRSAVRCLKGIHARLSEGGDLNVVDGICGHNNRKALDAFRSICTSSKIGEEVFLDVHFRLDQFNPNYDAVLRAVICGEWRYFCRESPQVANVYQLIQGKQGPSILFTLHLLRLLFSRASDTPKVGKGYVSLDDIRSSLKLRLDVDEVALRNLLYDLHLTGIWQVNTLKPKDFKDFSFARIGIPGLYLLTKLYKETSYLDCMAFDTNVIDLEVLATLRERVEHDLDCSAEFRKYLNRIERLEVERSIAGGLSKQEADVLFFRD